MSKYILLDFFIVFCYFWFFFKKDY
jgi:hypothetical protein